MLLHGTEFRQLSGMGAQGMGESCQVNLGPEAGSAGPVSSSTRDLGVQIQWQKHSQIKPLGVAGMEKQPETWWS